MENDQSDNNDIDIYADLDSGPPETSSELCDDSNDVKQLSEQHNVLLGELHVYGKLIEFEKQIKQLKAANDSLKATNQSLEAIVKKKDRQNQVLLNNISSLYKTAKLELERKDTMLKKMGKKYDDLVFRRRIMSKRIKTVESNNLDGSETNEIPSEANTQMTELPWRLKDPESDQRKIIPPSLQSTSKTIYSKRFERKIQDMMKEERDSDRNDRLPNHNSQSSAFGQKRYDHHIVEPESGTNKRKR